MKTKIEQHIKSQLAERSLNPSEGSWDKLGQLMDEEKEAGLPARPQERLLRFPKWWMLAVAASVVLFVSFVIVNSLEKDHQNRQIADTEISIPDKSASGQTNEPEQIVTSDDPAENLAVRAEEKQFNPTPKVEGKPEIKSKIREAQVKDQIEKPGQTSDIAFYPVQPESKKVENKISEEILVAQATEPETKTEKQEKKKSYVDSNMLLYSVENNQAISETNSNTRLVIIDLNK